ncbi:MAG TPA: polysaccharide pyruvyl transferase family protein [Gemmatimonadales bacterium]|nr:polysaccharide pyruvyl transferase family protein [Gemmatimonadales bacterium]
MILLYGYYGERNAGDDAFTTICANELVRRGHRQIGVLGSELPRVTHLPARALYFRRRFRGLSTRIEHARINHWLARGAQIVIGGGSLFRSSTSLIQLGRLLDRSPRAGHHALGVSVGPFRDRQAVQHCREVLERLDSIGVRDEVSLARAREIAPGANLRLTFDLAPLLSRWLAQPETEVPAQTGALGVALCGPALSEQGYQAIHKSLWHWLHGRPDRSVVLLPFNTHPRKGDLAIHERLGRELRGVGEVEFYRYTGDPRAMWYRIGRLDCILAMRLHAAVFGYCTNRPVLIVPYEEKCHAWARMIGHRPELVVDAPALDVTDVDRVSSALPGTVASLPISEAVSRATINFEWAD